MQNRLKNAFDGIKASDELKQSLKAKLAVAREERINANKTFSFKGAAIAAVACMLLLCLGFIGHYLYFTPITVISVDVNPSVELGVNRFDKVISVEAFNDAGEKIVSSVNVMHKNYQTAVDTLLDTTDFADYAEKEGLVYITVFGDGKRSNTVSEKLYTHTKNREHVSCQHGEGKDVKDAHGNGLSAGKYEAYLKLKELYPDMTVDQVKSLTMRQIKDLMQEATGEQDTPIRDESRPNREESGRGEEHGMSHGNKDEGGHKEHAYTEE